MDTKNYQRQKQISFLKIQNRENVSNFEARPTQGTLLLVLDRLNDAVPAKDVTALGGPRFSNLIKANEAIQLLCGIIRFFSRV